MKFYIHTFGCQMNVRESETAAGILLSMGYKKAERPEEASLILFNTCCIRELAERKAWASIGKTKGLKAQNPRLKVGVIGCMMAKQESVDELNRRFTFVDFSLGTNSLHKLYDILPRIDSGERVTLSESGDAEQEFNLPVYHNSADRKSVV